MARDALHGVLALSSKTISLGKLNGAFGAPVAGCSPGLTAGPLPHRHLQEQPAVPRPGSPKKLLRGTVMLLMKSNGTTGLGETKRKKKEREKKKKRKKGLLLRASASKAYILNRQQLISRGNRYITNKSFPRS